MDWQYLLKQTVEQKGSDLHLAAGTLPMIRIDGDLQSISDAPLTQMDMEAIVKAILSAEQHRVLESQLEMDLSFHLPDVARFRVNVFYQLRGLSIVFRVIPTQILSIEDLELPEIMVNLCDLSNGLVLVTGPTGSGKSTTLSALVDHTNSHQARHILTLEDPIEFVHQSKKCLIQQREVGHNTKSFNNALRAALREDPDVILVGEMRDVETIRLALTASETGHLVFATLHTSSAPKTINRIIDVFPAGEKPMIRSMLSESLQAVIAQTLIKRKAGGRVAVHEILTCTPAVRNLIREDKIHQILSVIQTGQAHGMVTVEKSLEALRQAGIID